MNVKSCIDHSTRSAESAEAGRKAMMLLELVVSLASASILMAGMTTAIVIANRSAEIARTRQSTSIRNIAGLDRLRSDLAEAYPATGRTATQVNLSVSDRTGDGIRDSISYQWLGAGAPLEMSVNSGAWQAITEKLEKFNLGWRTCSPQSAVTGMNAFEPNPSLVFQSRTIGFTTLSAKSTSLDVPTTYQANDLLVAALAVSGNQKGTMTGPSGWTKVADLNNLGMVSLGVWVTFANALPQADFSWKSNASAYGTVAHFRVTGGTAALTSATTFTGYSKLATAPSGMASADNSLAIRVFAGVGPMVAEEATNLPGHVAVTMRRQLLTDPSIGMAIRNYATGVVPSADFNLPSICDYATATLVFRP